ENEKAIRKQTILYKHSGLFRPLLKQYEDFLCSEQVLLWYEFSDVVGHDNTSGTNRYYMPLSLFVAQDDNMNSRIIAQAFVSNELAETYQ
ncbi:36695_t:CDS:2, partial [Racocetra persica]